MAGGWIAPISAFPATAGRVFPNFHSGAGSTGIKRYEGLGVEASVGADAAWELIFPLPPTLPSGTAKLRLNPIANATSGSAKVNPKGAVVAAATDFSSATLTAEGTQTITWAAGDADKPKDVKVTITPAMVANSFYVCNLVFETASWTLAAVSTWVVLLGWE